MNFITRAKLAIFPILMFTSSSLMAWTVSPTTLTMTQEKPQAFFSLSAGKDEEPGAIEISIMKREMDENGEDLLTEASHEFIIYPAKIILRKNGQKKVRVVWKEAKEIVDEKAYRIVIAGLPVSIGNASKNQKDENKETASNIQLGLAITTRYVNSLYISPKKANPIVKCSHITQGIEEGKKSITIDLVNEGNVHALVKIKECLPENFFEKFGISEEELESKSPSLVNILAHHKRKISIITDTTDIKKDEL